ncbi:MAG: hypothetical protein O3A46_00225 [Candidatus Poribacteria bacterium]|nr:hypothetical protein [Candidatus Poribacteria bacterium]
MEDSAGIVLFLLVIGAVVLVMIYRRAEDKRRLQAKREETQEWLSEQSRRDACLRILNELYEQQPQLFEQFVSVDEVLELVEHDWTADEILEWMTEQAKTDNAVVLGYQPLGDGARFDVSLAQPFRERHVYVIGKTGSGKTNFLRTLIEQDVERGDGIGVIAPEQEMLTEEVLPYIPDHRIDDVIYFNPADTERPVCFNPLHLEDGEDIDLRADELLTIFQRIMGEGGHRMNEILRHAVYALLERPGSTLLDVPRLLDPDDGLFREIVIRETRDPDTERFFRDVYPRFPKDAHLPIVNRLGRFLRPKTIRNVLCQPTPSFDFRKAMDAGKIMLFNFSDGILGETNCSILGNSSFRSSNWRPQAAPTRRCVSGATSGSTSTSFRPSRTWRPPRTRRCSAAPASTNSDSSSRIRRRARFR